MFMYIRLVFFRFYILGGGVVEIRILKKIDGKKIKFVFEFVVYRCF